MSASERPEQRAAQAERLEPASETAEDPVVGVGRPDRSDDRRLLETGRFLAAGRRTGWLWRRRRAGGPL